MLKLKLQYFGHLMWRTDSLEKTLVLSKIEGKGEGDDRGWDGWMASPTQWTRVWVNSGSWWWIGKPGVLQSMGSQTVGHNWVTELNWAMGSWKDRLKFAEVAWNRHQFLVIPAISPPALFRLTGLSKLLSVWCFISTCHCGYCQWEALPLCLLYKCTWWEDAHLWGISWLFHTVHWCNPLLSSSFYIGSLWLPPELWKWKLKFQLKAGDETWAEWINQGPWCWQLGLRLGLYWISAGPYATARLALLWFPYAFEIR